MSYGFEFFHFDKVTLAACLTIFLVMTLSLKKLRENLKTSPKTVNTFGPKKSLYSS